MRSALPWTFTAIFLLAACGSSSDEPGAGAGAPGQAGAASSSAGGGNPAAGSNAVAGGANQAGSSSSAGAGNSAAGQGMNEGGASAGGSPGMAGGAHSGGSAGAAGAHAAAGAAGQMTGAGGGSGGAGKAFSACRFHFGTIDSKAKSNSALVPELDLFTPGWIGQSDKFDMDYVCGSTDGSLSPRVPAMVSYIIAFTARRDAGLQDCNVSNGSNLCNAGATYIRAHHDRIIAQYKLYAQGFAKSCGTTRPLIWEMEPDFYQYSVGGDPKSLSATEAGALMKELISTVQASLPNALFSLDVSPWMPKEGADWFSHFDLSQVTFISTSGGGTDASGKKIRPNNDMTWAGVHQVTGKPILADTGYGIAGAPAGHDANWDNVANINARIADGVIGVTQYNPKGDWQTTIKQIRSQLSTPKTCP